MAIKLVREFKQNQQLSITPQLKKSIDLLQLSRLEIINKINNEIEENPFLKKDFDNDQTSNFDDMDLLDNLSNDLTLQNYLEDQLQDIKLSSSEKKIAQVIIQSLEENGLLQIDLDEIEELMEFAYSVKEIKNVLVNIIHDLEPAGVGARNLQECLMLQIKRKNRSDLNVYLAGKILEKTFDEFTKKHYQKIIKKFEVTEDELKLALEEILKLNPKPGGSMNETQRIAQTVVPDFHLNIEDGELQLSLNSRNAPELKVSREYKELLKGYQANQGKASKSQKDTVMFVRQKLDSAKWFIDAIVQRQNTLLNTMQTILNLQNDYFLTGDETKIRPMILKDIADKIEMDISTVSRVANSKYIQTPYGTFLLKTFFSESMQNDKGEEVSTREIKKILQDTVETEEKKKPYTDEKLAAILKEKGYPIARRTIAKYREQLDLPVARLRKEL